jgi:hypothetical protein
MVADLHTDGRLIFVFIHTEHKHKEHKIMSKMIVKTDNLNLRNAPNTASDDNIILAMPLGQEVNVIDSPPGERFWEIETDINGLTHTGFAGSRFLRQPLSQTKEKLLTAAVREWITYFKRGTGKEDIHPFYERVGDYFQQLGMNSDGRDTGHYWSAAFISFIVREAGYTNFKFSDGHWKYIYDAKAKRLANKATAPFWLFRLNEHKPQLGDLVCAWREDQPRTYDDVPNKFFPSHTDLVVEISSDSVMTIGGNVSNSVHHKYIPLNANGFITSDDKRFAIMRNNR